MSRRASLLLVPALLASCEFALDRPLATGEIRGIVLLDEGGVRRPGAGLVVLADPGLGAAITDESGQFVMTGLAEGTYLLRATLDPDHDGRPDGGFTLRRVTLETKAGVIEGRDLGTVVAGRFGAIEGVVSDANGPVAHAVVAIASEAALVGSEQLTKTDETGHFSFGRIVPGAWTLQALTTAGASGETSLEVSPDRIARPSLAVGAPDPTPATVRAVLRTSVPSTVPILVEVASGTAAQVTEVAPDAPLELSVPPGVYTLRARSRDEAFLPVVLPEVVVFGPVELAPIVLRHAPDAAARDFDRDGLAAGADADDDGDGCPDAAEPAATRHDGRSCADGDGDGFGDGIDPDDDADGRLDVLDACPQRSDPPGVDADIPECGAYPVLRLEIGVPAGAITDEPFRVEAELSGVTGGSEIAVRATGPGGATATPTADGEGRWLLSIALPGAWTVHVDASDELGEASEQAVVVVEAPEILLSLPSEATFEVTDPLVINAVAGLPAETLTWSWRELEPSDALTIDDAATPTATFRATAAGDHPIELEVTRGARSGRRTMVVHARASPIALLGTEAIDATVGEPAALLAFPEETLLGLGWGWAQVSGPLPLAIAGGDTQAPTVTAPGVGRYVIEATATKGPRTGTHRVTLDAHPVGAITLVGDAAFQLTGEERTWAVAVSPAMPGATFTFTADAGNPGGSTFTQLGAGFTLHATTAGLYAWDVVARAGARRAVGSISLQVGRPPLRVTTSVAPTPTIVTHALVTLKAVSPDLPNPALATWSWVPRASNPEAVTLSGGTTPLAQFLPTIPGEYVFDLTVSYDGRQAKRVVVAAVDPASTMYMAIWWYGNRIGEYFELGADTTESLSDAATYRWTGSPSNPEQLVFAHPYKDVAIALPTVAGTYHFTCTLVDGSRVAVKTVQVEILPIDPDRLGFSIYPWPSAATAGSAQTIYVESADDLDGTTTWVQDPGNPAQLELVADGPWSVDFTPSVPGEYRFTANHVFGTATGTAQTSFTVLPAIPISLRYEGGYVSGPLRVIASTTEPNPVTWSWTLVTWPTGTGGFTSRPSITVTGSRVQMNPTVRPGTYVFRARATEGVRVSTQTITITATDSPGPRWMKGPERSTDYLHEGAVGVPIKLQSLCRNCFEPIYTWTQVETDPVQVTLAGATSAEMTFVAPQVGTYAFQWTVKDWDANGDSGEVRVVVTQRRPDAYIDGPPNMKAASNGKPTRIAWACRSGRADVTATRWEAVGTPYDGGFVAQGAFLFHDPDTIAVRSASFKCVVTTADGVEHVAYRPVILIPDNVYDYAVYFLKPSTGAPLPDCNQNPLPKGCRGTFEDPLEGFGRNFLTGFGYRVIVLLSGEYAATATYGGTATTLLGGVDPVTGVRDSTRTPSVVTWASTSATAPLLRLSDLGQEHQVSFEGVHLKVTAAPGVTTPLTVLESVGNNVVLGNTIEITANPGQAVTAMRFTQTAQSFRGMFAGNRVSLVGGAGDGLVQENCRGMLLAHNLLTVDASSTMAAGFRVDCATGTYAKKAIQVVNNMVSMANGGVGYALDGGAPALDATHRFASNWFAGTGPFATATRFAGGPLTFATAADTNAAPLLGGGNLSDSGCLRTGATFREAGAAAGSACENAAGAPNPAALHDLPRWLAIDADNTRRDVTAGYGTTVDVGPDEL